MKDYTFNLEEQKEFILDYIKYDKNIIIHFANGINYAVPNTLNNEKIILKKMKTQVVESESNEKKIKQKISSKKCLTDLSLIAGSIGSLFFACAFKNNVFSSEQLIGIIGSLFSGFVASGVCFASSNKYKEKLEDLEKNKFFLDNEMAICRALTKNNVLQNASNETKDFAKEEEKNINTIDKYSYSCLAEAMDLSKIQDDFAFDNYDSIEENNVKKRTRNR